MNNYKMKESSKIKKRNYNKLIFHFDTNNNTYSGNIYKFGDDDLYHTVFIFNFF